MNTLAEICDKKREHIAKRKLILPESALLDATRITPAPRGFKRALEEKISQKQIALIAEIKKASPSKGIIRQDFDPRSLARDYLAGGATCLSVLTDEHYFMGHDDYLKDVRNEVPLPVLRKDFMLDPYQIIESRALGADCVLLIMAALSDVQATELYNAATSLAMDVLVEVHDRKELDRALGMGVSMIGINNRNLKTLKVDLATAESLMAHIPKNNLAVCESGINTSADIARMRLAGFSCFLVGESLMREPNVKQATQRLLGIEHD